MKPGTFTQMYVQLVFAVKNRDAVLTKDIRKRVFEYMSGIITNLNHKSIIVNGTSNHVHILLGLNPSFQFQILFMILKEALPCLSIMKNSALVGSPGRRVMEDLHIAVHKQLTFTITLKIRNHTIKREHSVKNISTFLLKMRQNLINNFYLIFGMIAFNLYEVWCVGILFFLQYHKPPINRDRFYELFFFYKLRLSDPYFELYTDYKSINKLYICRHYNRIIQKPGYFQILTF